MLIMSEHTAADTVRGAGERRSGTRERIFIEDSILDIIIVVPVSIILTCTLSIISCPSSYYHSQPLFFFTISRG